MTSFVKHSTFRVCFSCAVFTSLVRVDKTVFLLLKEEICVEFTMSLLVVLKSILGPRLYRMHQPNNRSVSIIFVSFSADLCNYQWHLKNHAISLFSMKKIPKSAAISVTLNLTLTVKPTLTLTLISRTW